MKPRAVTGVGVVSPLGIGRAAFFEATHEGRRATPAEGKAEVPSFDPAAHLGDKGLRSLDRLTKLLLVACRLGLRDAGLKADGAWAPGVAGHDVGLVCSNAYGSLEAITELDRVALLEDARYINPSRFPLTVANSAAGYASIWEDLRAVNVSVSDGNCGGLDAVACADTLLENRRARVILAGGAEAMSEALHLAFQRIGVLGPDAGPDANTAPFLGEGAALVALETMDGARGRGAEVLAQVVGYGTAFDPPEREASLVFPSAVAMQGAVQNALEDARVAAADVDSVVCGASGIRAFDEAELVALDRVFGRAGGPGVVAPKLALGETLGAGGALGMVTALAMLKGARSVPAPVREKLRTEARTPARTVLVTSLGYYGNASALVMRAVPG